MSRVRRWYPILVAALVFACGKSGGGEGDGKGGKGGGPGGGKRMQFPVEVTTVETRRVEYAVTGDGSVEAFEQVQVTARVAGVVEKVRFVEGGTVDKGQVLIEIEPQRYQLAVKAARATLEKVKASEAEAAAGLARREEANKQNPGLIPGEELETWRTRVRTAAAEAAQAKVALEQAQLNLRDAYVKAPIAGTIQTRTVQTGQYVQPGAILATLVRRDPLLLRFEVPENQSARVKPGMAARFRAGGGEREYSARLTHVAAVADARSRMVPITAEVDDPARDELRPGAFAEVVVPVGAAEGAPVIPQTAVRPSERGFLAFVVEGGVAREKVLTLGLRTADGQVEVRAGLAGGEQLVVRGAEALRDGAEVRVVGGEGAPATQPAGGAEGARK